MSADEDVVATATLRDGRTLVVRHGGPDDLEGVVRFYDGLTSQDHYRRFFSGGPPSRAWIEGWVHVAERGGILLLAVVPDADGERVVGEAGYGTVDDRCAELGIAVAPDHRGWLGPFLLDALVTAAREAGLVVLQAEVLTENRPMLRLLASRGDAMLPLDDFRTVRIAIPTSGRAPVWPPAIEHPRILVEVSGGRWRGSAAAEAAGVHVIACPRRPDHCPARRGQPCPLVTDADLVVLVPRRGVDGDQNPDDAALFAAHCTTHRGKRVVIDDGHITVESVVGAAQAEAAARADAPVT